MSNFLTPELLAQLFVQDSTDPLLILVTMTHPSFTTIRLVNNTKDITSRGNVYTAFPMTIKLPTDDGENQKQVAIEFDNVGLDLLDEIRSVTTPIQVTLELILASIPDAVQMSIEELSIFSISYNKSKITANLQLENFLYTELTSEKYTPQNFPGLF